MKALIKEITGNEMLVIKSSYYFDINDSTVRVSNHLPNRCNWENEENKNNAVFIFINENGNLNETMIDKYLSVEFSIINYSYFLFENEIDAIESINYIKTQL